MERNVTCIRRARKPQSLPLFEWADTQRRLVGRPTAADRFLRSRGHSPSMARPFASLAGLPAQGDDND